MKTLLQIREASHDGKTGDKEAYQAFFRKALKKFGVTEPDQLRGDKEKEFYDYVDAGWKGDNEKPEPGDKREGLVKGRGFPGIKADKKKKNKRVHGANKNIAYNYDRDKRKESVELDEARSGYVGTISGGNSIAIKIDGIDDGEARLGTRNGMKAIDAFKKIAKKTYADAKGKKTIPAVKKAIKMQGATQYYAKWKSDSAGYKDDSVEIWYTKSVKESVDIEEGKLDGIAKALTSMASKPEFKKVAKSLKSLAMRAKEGDKKAAKQIATQLDKMIMKVDKKSANKLMKLADLTMTYESVSVDMRTKGFKTAMARNLLRKEKAQAKKKSEIDEIIDALNAKLRGEDVSIGAGNIDMGPGKKLGKIRKRKKSDED